MSTESSGGGSGIGFFGALLVAFIVLKLTGFITWSWLWVLAPCWIPFLFIVAIALLIAFLKGA